MEVKRGIFQRGTLSPIPFLLAFNLVIKFANTIPSLGTKLRIEILTPRVSLLLVLTCKINGQGKNHLSTFVDYLPDGKAKVTYTDESCEVINPHSKATRFLTT
jgi:hypothetical protein